MPRENRKRGKKHKKEKTEDEYVEARDHEQPYAQEIGENQPGPSWIRQRNNAEEDPEVNPEAPFGFVNPDVKAYFKTVDEKLREWQEVRDDGYGDEEDGEDVNEGAREILSSLNSTFIRFVKNVDYSLSRPWTRCLETKSNLLLMQNARTSLSV